MAVSTEITDKLAAEFMRRGLNPDNLRLRMATSYMANIDEVQKKDAISGLAAMGGLPDGG